AFIGARPASLAVREPDRRVRAVAEGLVARRSAPAERHAVADLVRPAVRADDGDPSADPDRAADLLRGVLHEADRRRQLRLDGLSVLVSHDETSRGTARRLVLGGLRRAIAVADLDEAPDSAEPVAEAR